MFNLSAVYSEGLDKCIMVCIYHCSVIQSFFSALKVLHALPINNLLTPENHWFFNCIHSFAFSRMSYSWNPSICSLFRLFSFISCINLRIHHVFSWLNSSFSFSAEYVQTTAQLHSSHMLAKYRSKFWSQASTVHEPGTSWCSSWM